MLFAIPFVKVSEGSGIRSGMQGGADLAGLLAALADSTTWICSYQRMSKRVFLYTVSMSCGLGGLRTAIPVKSSEVR